ncbi:hypothetical protein [Haladaptatus sp. CMAA 1911]|uniref:hypothetical protein n=1 Tax=unclassified Haladaptatus TaxID=2622732 RepID=UPI003754215D
MESHLGNEPRDSDDSAWTRGVTPGSGTIPVEAVRIGPTTHSDEREWNRTTGATEWPPSTRSRWYFYQQATRSRETVCGRASGTTHRTTVIRHGNSFVNDARTSRDMAT